MRRCVTKFRNIDDTPKGTVAKSEFVFGHLVTDMASYARIPGDFVWELYDTDVVPILTKYKRPDI